MARLKLRIVAQDAEGDAQGGATVKLYQPGTGAIAGSATTGTPFAGNLYAGISGGDPVSTTRTADSAGQVVVYTDTPSRCDVGIEAPGVVGVFAYEEFQYDPADIAPIADLADYATVASLADYATVASLADYATLTGAETLENKTLDAPALTDPTISTLTTAGDLLYGTGSGALARLPKGTALQHLRMNAGATAPEWGPAGGAGYNVLEYGLATGSTSANAAANTTALQALWALVAGEGGGTIHFPPGTYPLNATTLDHGLGYGAPINLLGSGGAAVISLYGTTGPFLNIATGSTSAISRAFIRDLRIQHAEIPTSGATIQLGSVMNFWFQNVLMPNAGSGLGSLISVRLAGAPSGIHFSGCKFETRNDYATLVADGLTPYGLEVANTSPAGGLYMDDTDWSGVLDGSNGRGTGIRFNNSAIWDTVWFGPGTLIKDWANGIVRSGAHAGAIANVMAHGLTVDGCTSVNLQLEPSGAGVGTWMFNGCWFSSELYNVILSESGTGSVAGIWFDNCYFTNATAASLSIGAGVDDVRIAGCTVASVVTDAEGSAIYVGSGTNNLIVANNRISVGSTALAAYDIHAGVTSAVVVGNLCRGKAGSFGPATGAALVHANNAVLA